MYRDTRRGLFRRRSAEQIQTEIVAQNAREQPGLRSLAVIGAGRIELRGSRDGQGGVHKGFTPACLSKISAIWPPSRVSVTRRPGVLQDGGAAAAICRFGHAGSHYVLIESNAEGNHANCDWVGSRRHGCFTLWGADWLTDGGNPQRTGWQKDEKILSKENVKDMKLRWKLQLDNQPRQLHSLFPPLIVGRINTASGPKQIAIEAGISDNIYAIDVDAGTILWKKHFPYTSEVKQQDNGGPLCPAGLTAVPTIGPANAQGARTLYAISGDGLLHQLNVADGEEVALAGCHSPSRMPSPIR